MITETMTAKNRDGELLSLIESHVKIYFTREYGKFRFMRGNRDVDPNKVKRLVNDIRTGLNLLAYCPVIVNEKMEIIDGQHRFMAARELKENIWFVVKPELRLKDVPVINSRSSTWKKKDFLISFVDLGKPSYKYLEELITTYKGLSIPVGASLIHSGKADDKEIKEVFTEGFLTMVNEETALKLLNFCRDFEPYMDSPYSRRMVGAAEVLLASKTYKHDRMLKKLEETGERITDIHNVKAILSQMEKIYNHKSRERLLLY